MSDSKMSADDLNMFKEFQNMKRMMREKEKKQMEDDVSKSIIMDNTKPENKKPVKTAKPVKSVKSVKAFKFTKPKKLEEKQEEVKIEEEKEEEEKQEEEPKEVKVESKVETRTQVNKYIIIHTTIEKGGKGIRKRYIITQEGFKYIVNALYHEKRKSNKIADELKVSASCIRIFKGKIDTYVANKYIDNIEYFDIFTKKPE